MNSFCGNCRERRCDMRLATFTLACLGLLFVGTAFAAEGSPDQSVPAANYVTTMHQAVATPVLWYGYRPAPGWNRYYRLPPYYAYHPRYYWYGTPRHFGYYAVPYRGYAPYGFGFEYNGPRRSFSFSF